MNSPATNQMKKPNQLLAGIWAIMYRQETRPSIGMSDKLWRKASTAINSEVSTNSHMGILCWNKAQPDSNF